LFIRHKELAYHTHDQKAIEMLTPFEKFGDGGQEKGCGQGSWCGLQGSWCGLLLTLHHKSSHANNAAWINLV